MGHIIIFYLGGGREARPGGAGAYSCKIYAPDLQAVSGPLLLHFSQRKGGGTYVWEISDIGVTCDYVQGLVDYACVDDHDVGKLSGES